MAYNSKYTGAEVENLLGKIDDKQDTISDLASIREGAAKGATALQSIPEEYVTEADLEDKDYAPMSVLDNKVDKVSGKGLSTEDFTSALKAKLESLSNYNDAEIAGAVSSLQTQINTLVSGNADDAINSFNEIIAFLDGVKDTQDLSSIIASIEQQVAGKMDKVTLATVATSGDYNDLNNKPTIPTKTSELTNDSGFITSADNVASATKLQTMRYINGSPFDGTANAVSYAVCATGASTTAKTVSISRFSLATGSQVRVKFSNANTATAPTLNVGSTGPKRMSYKGSLITNANFSFSTAKIYTFTYDGTYWVLEGDWDEASSAEPMICAYTIGSYTANHIELENHTYNGQTMYYREGAIISITNPFNKDIVFEGGSLTLDGNEYEAGAFTLKVGATILFSLGVDPGVLYKISSVVESNSGDSSEGGSSAYAEVDHGTSDTTFELTPNTFHVWDEVAELNLSLGAETSGVANEYLFQFTSGSEPTTLALPDNLKWANDSAPTIASNMIYQVSILKGLASVLEFSDEATGGSIFPVTLQVGDNGDIGILVYDALVAGAVLNSGDLTFEDDGKTFDVTEYSVDYEGIYLAGYEDGPMIISYYLRQSGELYKEQM